MKKDLLIIVAIGIIFFILGNWVLSITSVDEGRNLDATLRMLESKNFLVPYYNCQERFEKPPLLYYITALTFSIFGVTEFSARLPSGLAAIAVAVMTYLFGLEFFDRRKALYGAIVYCLLIHNWIEARAAVPEMILTFFMSLGLWLFIKERYTPGWLALSLAFLAKGPVGVVLPVGVYTLWKRNLRFFDPKGIVFFVITGGLWYALMIAKYGYGYFYRFFIYENVMRYTGQRITHPFPIYYYPAIIGISYLLFLPRLYHIVRHRRKEEKPLLLWFLFVFIFFSLAKNRLHHYMLFLYPPLSLLTASSMSKNYLRVAGILGAMLLTVMLIFSYHYEKERFVPKAVEYLKKRSPQRVYFYKADDAAVVFYTRRCINTLKDMRELTPGDIIITEQRFAKDFPEAEILIKGKRDFQKDWVLLKVREN